MFALGLVMLAIAATGITILFSLALYDIRYIGVLLLLAGVFHAVVAAGCRGWASVFWLLAVAAVYSVGGLMVVFDPTLEAEVTRSALAGVILSAGLVRAALTWSFRGGSPSRWMVFAGLAALPLAAAVLFGGPLAGAFGVALLLTCEMFLQGGSCLTVAVSSRKNSGTVRA